MKSAKKRLSNQNTASSFLRARREKSRLIADDDNDSDVEIIEMPSVVVQLDDSLDSFPADIKKKPVTNTDNARSSPINTESVPKHETEEIKTSPVETLDLPKSDTIVSKDENDLDQQNQEICVIQQMAIDLNVSLNGIEKECDQNDTLKPVESDQPPVDFDVTLTELPETEVSSNGIGTYADVLKSAEKPLPSSTIISAKPSSSEILFFEDHEGSFNDTNIPAIPLYETISDDSFICDKTLTPVKPQRAQKLARQITKHKIQPTRDDDDVEIIFDSPNMPSPLPKRRRTIVNTDLDDSVVFVSESLSTAPAVRANINYININSSKFTKNKPNKLKTTQNKRLMQQRLKHQPPAKRIV